MSDIRQVVLGVRLLLRVQVAGAEMIVSQGKMVRIILFVLNVPDQGCAGR